MRESKIKGVKRVMKYSVAILCLVLGCMSMVGCKGEVNLTSQTQATTQAVESQKSLMPEGNKGMEEQVIGGVGGAVREGKALIEGNKVCENGIITNEAYKNVIEKYTTDNEYDNSLHTWTEFYSKTLGKVVLIDNNKKSGTRMFFNVEGGKSFYGVSGDSLINQSAEVSMQTYVAMKGLANAIDGK